MSCGCRRRGYQRQLVAGQVAAVRQERRRSFAHLLYLLRNCVWENSGASGITSKPAIEDHFKTGQRTITLDDLFSSPAGGLASPVLTSPVASSPALRCRLSYQADVLQDHIPVLPFLR